MLSIPFPILIVPAADTDAKGPTRRTRAIVGMLPTMQGIWNFLTGFEGKRAASSCAAFQLIREISDR